MMVARTYPSFALRSAGQALAAACASSAVLAVASLAAWPSSGRDSLVRTLRLTLATWLAAVVLYPGLAADFLPLRRWPWWICVSLVGLLWLACYLPRRVRPALKEILFTALALFAFFYTPAPRAGFSNLRALAGREFTEQDVIVLGFDSISHRDVASLLAGFVPSRGTKIVYTNASTPVTLTGGAWRSLLSGQMPPHHDLVPGSIWPRDRRNWLPAQLAQRGYRPTFLQDDPKTNVYRSDESLRVSRPQGWQHFFVEFAWEVLFPLSTAGGRFWVGALRGPAMEPSQQAYCARCFIDSVLREMALEAKERPVFWAVHSCFVHEPPTLHLLEANRISGWWKWSPIHLDGARLDELGESAIEQFMAARLESFQELLRETLGALDREGILGRATVFLVSDHGPRRKGLPAEISQHVMLTAFLPGERRDVVVNDATSLADVAPTVRARLGLEAPPSDGVPLPMGGDHRPDRQEISPRENPVRLLDVWSLRPAQLRELLALQPDGTFTIDAALLSNLIASQHAALPPQVR
jgi:hypothetical protein